MTEGSHAAFSCSLRRLLLVSTALAMASISFSVLAEETAQLAQAEPSRQIAFSIPAQDLDSTLTALADQVGLRLMFRSEDVAGVRTAGLSGNATVGEALRHLLGGTGMTWRFTDAKTVTLTKVAADGAMQLDPVSVEGQNPADGGG